MLFANAYNDDDEGNENRLNFWFNLDEWTLDEAALISLDLDPDSIETLKSGEWCNFKSFSGKIKIKYEIDTNGFPIPVGVSEDGFEMYMTKQEANLLDMLQGMFNDRKRLIGRFTKAKPNQWIDVAIEKKLPLSWLDWATEKGFYEPKILNKIDKPLSNTERETLLVIIAALAKEAKIDIEKTSKAGDLIANMTQLIGTPIGATTIETHLKKINQAIVNRTK